MVSCKKLNSLMAQWIARMTSDHKVGGSSPSGVVLFCPLLINKYYSRLFNILFSTFLSFLNKKLKY